MAKEKMFKPMLADPIEPEKYPLKFPLLVSTKIDGIRVLVRDGVAYSRSMKPIPNKYVQSVLGHASLNGLDGELVVGPPNAKDAMQVSQSVMRIEGEPNFRWYVFDDFSAGADMPFHARFRLAGLRVDDFGSKRVTCLGHGVAKNQDDLDEMEATALKAGFEGLMVRDPNGRYKFGRSTAKEGILNKVKRFADAEAEVIGFTERMHNDNEATEDELGHTERSTAKEGLRPAGDLGALVCQLLDQGGARAVTLDADGVSRPITFNIGTGFTQAQREELWAERGSLEGRIVKFRHFAASGAKIAPRFPAFVGFRSPLDL